MFGIGILRPALFAECQLSFAIQERPGDPENTPIRYFYSSTNSSIMRVVVTRGNISKIHAQLRSGNYDPDVEKLMNNPDSQHSSSIFLFYTDMCLRAEQII